MGISVAGAGMSDGLVEPRRPVALVILDGWGVAPEGPGNAVALADTPNFDRLWASHARGTMQASGLAVGLPDGQIGNSEVGHLNLGAGRVVYQDLTRINRAVADGSFDANPTLVDAIDRAVRGDRAVHVLGLLSQGGVHSHMDHMERIVRRAALRGARRIYVHAITDGRDVAPDSALADVADFEQLMDEVSAQYRIEAYIATIVGRYWAMDRDRRWDRTQRAFDAIVGRLGTRVATARSAIGESHALGITDEFVEPWVITGPQGLGSRSPALADGDVVIFANFRPDRMRQMVHALVDRRFDGFTRSGRPDLDVVCMCEYDHAFGFPVMFAPDNVEMTLADVLEGAGLGQLHVAETEKYAHVTYFFNGGVEVEHDGEVRVLVDSPRDVATYDLKPEMSAAAAADAFCAHIGDSGMAFAIINFANPDMVGHTGVLAAAIAACEATDVQLARVVDAVHALGGICIVTADHGNAEVMVTPEGKPHTAHTTNPVPLVVTLPESAAIALRSGGKLADVAPTVLQLLGLDQPPEMTGRSLLVRAGAAIS